jgi:hypothetical protein
MRYPGATLALTAATLACAAAPAPAGAAATRAEYLAQIEPVCREANEEAKRIARQTNRALKKRLRKASQQAKNGKSGKEIGDIFTLIIIKQAAPENRLFERTTALIRSVPPAPGDEAVVTAWLAGRDTSSGLVREAIRAGKAGKPNRMFSFLDDSTVALRRGQQPVQAFGLQHCFIELPVT